MAYTSNRKAHDAHLEKGIIKGMNATLADSVDTAMPFTPVVTGTAQGSIRFEPVKWIDGRLVGEFGSYNVDYFKWLELGTRYMVGLHILRRAADLEFPKLGDNIKAALR